MRRLDAFLRQPGGDQLLPVGFDEIEEYFLWQITMSGCARREEEKWIFLAHGIRVFDFVEQAGSVRELRFEFRPHFFTDLEAASLNPRTDGCLHIPRTAAK